MPKYVERVPEFVAVQFTGGNLGEVLQELGPRFSSAYTEGKTYESVVVKCGNVSTLVRRGSWVVVDVMYPETYRVVVDSVFRAGFEPVKRVGRPRSEGKARKADS